MRRIELIHMRELIKLARLDDDSVSMEGGKLAETKLKKALLYIFGKFKAS